MLNQRYPEAFPNGVVGFERETKLVARYLCLVQRGMDRRDITPDTLQSVLVLYRELPVPVLRALDSENWENDTDEQNPVWFMPPLVHTVAHVSLENVWATFAR